MDIPRLLENLRIVGTDTATVEVKAAAGGLPKTVPETLSAFANGRSGTIGTAAATSAPVTATVG